MIGSRTRLIEMFSNVSLACACPVLSAYGYEEMERELEDEKWGKKRASRFSMIWTVAFACCGLFLSACKTTSGGGDFEMMVARFVVETDQGGAVVAMPLSGARIQVNPKATLTEYDIVNVAVADLELGRCLQFTLTHQASRAIYQTSATNQGRRLVLLVNGKALGLRRMDGPISNGVVHMFVEIPDAGLPELAKNLRETCIEVQKKING